MLLLGIAFFSLLVGGRFLSAFNLSLVLQQVTIIGIVGIAQTLIILTAGIDLSVGAIMVLSSVVMGKLAVQVGVPVPIAFLLGLGVGAALRRHQWRPGGVFHAAAVHRDARHLEHLLRAESLVFGERDHPVRRTSRRRPRSCSSPARRSTSSARG